MHHRFGAIFVATICTAVFALIGASAAHARGNESALSRADEQFLDKAAVIINAVCANVYPAPASPLACIRSINEHIYKVFPLGKKKAEALGILGSDAVVADNEESREFSKGVLVVLEECRGKAFNVCTNKALHVIAGSFDPNTAYFDRNEAAAFSTAMEGSFFGIGLQVDGLLDKHDPLVVVEPVLGSPAAHAGILPNDHVVRINGRHVSTFRDVDSAVKAIRGREGTTVALTIARDGKVIPKPFLVTRGRIESSSVTGSVIAHNGKQFGLITVQTFDDGVCERIARKYREISSSPNTKLHGLIFSVETDLGGSLPEAHCTLDLFADAPYFILERSRAGLRPYTPPRRVINPFDPASGSVPVVPEFPGDITGGLPILGVVDGLSASASELVMRELQHRKRAPIAGTLSFGKGSVQVVRGILDGLLKVTHGEFVVGSETDYVPVQCLGVTPDIPFDRGFDPKLEDGKRARDCSREGSIASAGEMPGHPSHAPFTEAELAGGREMLEAYKQYLADNQINEKRRARIEKFKEFAKRNKAKEKQ